LKLWAISDVHVGAPENRALIERLPAHPEDWLVLGGDVGETLGHLRFVLETLGPRFARLIWVPGNHELWTLPGGLLRGEALYRELVALCRRHGALTPEDPYPVIQAGGVPHLLAPLFTLYDYSFCPDGMGPEAALAWAVESGVVCADETMLWPDPYPSRQAWCAARCEYSERRLSEALATHEGPTVLIDHFPLRRELAVLPLIPRFSIWCGTRRTEDWHRRFRASAVVYGHLHIPRTRKVDGVRFQEASLGYPRQWQRAYPDRRYLHQVLPASDLPEP